MRDYKITYFLICKFIFLCSPLCNFNVKIKQNQTSNNYMCNFAHTRVCILHIWIYSLLYAIRKQGITHDYQWKLIQIRVSRVDLMKPGGISLPRAGGIIFPRAGGIIFPRAGGIILRQTRDNALFPASLAKRVVMAAFATWAIGLDHFS